MPDCPRRYVKWNAQIFAAVSDDTEDEIRQRVTDGLARITVDLADVQGAIISSGPVHQLDLKEDHA